MSAKDYCEELKIEAIKQVTNAGDIGGQSIGARLCKGLGLDAMDPMDYCHQLTMIGRTRKRLSNVYATSGDSS